ncbi:Os05g0370650 [Oryza sativa Japonica Group]|uniref:Os05g0370650 protein n=1 Tax=Oryza sativa subsp. japonica TaxID=39947 RepID=A0A0P0WLH7_ORYSJ|nr:hypothetical protein EE612_029055 [Oryza sativa]BAS93682.1 Os05g0370650 [Oryza sativa Japonica Group]
MCQTLHQAHQDEHSPHVRGECPCEVAALAASGSTTLQSGTGRGRLLAVSAQDTRLKSQRECGSVWWSADFSNGRSDQTTWPPQSEGLGHP